MRPIDADKLTEIIKSVLADMEPGVFKGGLSLVFPILAGMPTIEAEPVRHGRWIMTRYATTSKRGRNISNKKYECSECGYQNGRKKSNHCPNCGARMDLEGEG